MIHSSFDSFLEEKGLTWDDFFTYISSQLFGIVETIVEVISFLLPSFTAKATLPIAAENYPVFSPLSIKSTNPIRAPSL